MTDEEVGLVDKWVADKKPSYPIVIVKPGAFDQALGVSAFPTHAVVDPEGNLTYVGHSSESALSKAQKGAKSGSMWPKRLQPAAQAIRKGDLGLAWGELQKLSSDATLPDREKSLVTSFTKHVEGAAADALKRGQDLFKQDLVLLALQSVEGIANANPALPASEDAKKLVADLKALPTFELELKAGEIYAKAKAREDERDYIGAVQGYKEAAKKGEGAKIAFAASDKAKEIVHAGLPGFTVTCEKCGKLKKACEKHAKVIKL